MVCYALANIEIGRNITEGTEDSLNVNRQAGRTIVSTRNFRAASPQIFDRDLDDILRRVKARCGAFSTNPREFQAELAAEKARQSQAEAGADIDEVTLTAGSIGALEQAQKEIDANQVTLQAVLEWLLIIIGLLTAIRTVGQIFPPLRLVTAPLPLIIRRAVGFQGAIIARKAANDAAWGAITRQLQILKAA